MKNKEEPSIDLTRGNPSTPADRHISGCASVETTGSTFRQDSAASASIEKPALSRYRRRYSKDLHPIPTSISLPSST